MDARFTLLQSAWWAAVRGRLGWTVATDEPLVLQRSVGPVRLAYAPHAPAPSQPISARESAERLARAVEVGARERGIPRAHIVRWDLPYAADELPPEDLVAARFRPARATVQPPDTTVLDLTPSEDDLLAAMKGKTRYNVRLAEKRGVEVALAEDADALDALPDWYALYRETATRDRIAIHSFDYYRTVLATAVEMRAEGRAAPTVRVYSATHEGDHLGGIVVASWDGMSTYLYGASSNTKRNLMANYLVQWRAIRDARRGGDRWYDMFGIPPTDDPDHPMHGLYRFKTGFGGEILHRLGCWDLDLSPLTGRAFRTAERARSWYFHRFRKRIAGGSR